MIGTSIILAAAILGQESAPLAPLAVSQDGRHFVTRSGSPFFWLGDTAWTMVSRLTLPEIDQYLDNRQRKGFNVIQLVLVPWGVRESGNLAGEKPYLENDMSRPNPKYFDHVELVIRRVQSRGMYAAVVPFWLAGLPEPGPDEIAKHRAYARYLGQRFGRLPLIWLLGADRWPNGWAEVIRAFAVELEKSSGRSDLLITHHPAGGQSSSRFFHEEPWLDFNMLQSGHNSDIPALNLTIGDYAKNPTKPVLDGEAAYENITNALVPFAPGVRVINDYDVRRQAYQSVFSGAAGHTYGACEVYEFHREGMGKARWTIGLDWRKALDLPGSGQMRHLKSLVESRSPLTRFPDPSLVVSPVPEDANRRLCALRDRRGQYAYVYIPHGTQFELNTRLLGPGLLIGKWFDPRNGQFSDQFAVATGDRVSLLPPSLGERVDWVLVLHPATSKG